jgi:DtxR family Mn-dependent transcriptional regulator
MKSNFPMRNRHASVSEEDYLKAIYHMQLELQEPISARLSEALGVTPPAVTAALRRLARRGNVRLDAKAGRIRLTAKGRAIAQSLVMRHRLIERLLTDVLGMDWKVVHAEAEKLEHAISPEIERRLLERFGRDSSCPHGNPFIGGLGKLRRQGVIALSEARPGMRVRVIRVDEHEAAFLVFLEKIGLRPGVEFRVLARSYDATLSIQVGSQQFHLGMTSTGRVWVRPV